MKTTRHLENGNAAARQGSVLIVVLWIVFGLISVTLYFAHSMTFELRSSDNRVAGIEAEQAIEGGRRYCLCLLSNVNVRGVMPDAGSYLHEAVPVGNAKFWFIGRSDEAQTTASPTTPSFGLIDEASKINLNSASSNVLMNLPRMTSDLVANILAWRSTNTTTTSGGAESDTYLGQQPPYLCKNAPFESVDELRLVYHMDMDILYGEDANLNGILDPNENDGDASPPNDNLDGHLDPGLLEYVTVYTKEPTTSSNGATRLNLSVATTRATLTGILTTNGISSDRATQIATRAGNGPWTSALQFYYSSGMTTAEFMKVEGSLRGASVVGLINVNTASQAVLACLPGLTNGQAAQLVAYRQSNNSNTGQNSQIGSVIWVTSVLNSTDAQAAGPYLTGRSYQYTADIAAVGHDGRGYRRNRFVFDISQGAPVILHRQDLSQLGWALGKETRNKLLTSN